MFSCTQWIHNCFQTILVEYLSKFIPFDFWLLPTSPRTNHQNRPRIWMVVVVWDYNCFHFFSFSWYRTKNKRMYVSKCDCSCLVKLKQFIYTRTGKMCEWNSNSKTSRNIHHMKSYLEPFRKWRSAFYSDEKPNKSCTVWFSKYSIWTCISLYCNLLLFGISQAERCVCVHVSLSVCVWVWSGFVKVRQLAL